MFDPPNLHSRLTPIYLAIYHSPALVALPCFLLRRLIPAISVNTAMLSSHIVDAPIFEKPRLFSHWKPSLAQVSSDLPVHNRDPATLRVCSAPYSTHELSDTTVLGSASGGPECKCSSRSKASGITIPVIVPCAITSITERHQPLSWWVLNWCATALAPLSPLVHLSVISLSAP
jgi:hypothetical protein